MGTLLMLFSDEILYHAKLHPEQYSDTFSSAQLKQLHTSIRYVCQTAVDLLGDSSKFPEEWLFNHRWNKGKKDAVTTLPNGAKIIHLTVGGRTSCVVPSVQKKTGAVAGDLKENGSENLNVEKPSKGKTVKPKKEKGPTEEKLEKVNGSKDAVKVKSKKRKNEAGVRETITETNTKEKRRKAAGSPTTMKAEDDTEVPFESRRRSGRVSKTKS
jgi:formamidopyrimidine-DNA glycosylase